MPGAVPSPNIWGHPQVYETENRALDPDGRIEQAMRSVDTWAGRDVLDLGCGTGFHLPRWAADARTVTGVEPHPDLAAAARRRTARIPAVTVLSGTAQAVPLPDRSVDVAQARWAYFFGPGCEPGLAELDRVVRPGGTAFVIDNDARRSTFGGWFRRGYPALDPDAVERFWSRHGWQRIPVDIVLRCRSREDLEAVVRIELPGAVADAALAAHDGAEVDYAVNLWWRRF
ncbi:methyltransferase domain-containing protein [Nocardioides mesophilus]|uniref:Methyltransferase domain-containing protein n=1 Tax=Nocardioides mesophilus TaxID=433659 RepID=A0A7G9RHB7_9ACTN|nr:methyltransferase domain-containing protein [Nocardioides mesophilus]